jgi:substrate-binding family protein
MRLLHERLRGILLGFAVAMTVTSVALVTSSPTNIQTSKPGKVSTGLESPAPVESAAEAGSPAASSAGATAKRGTTSKSSVKAGSGAAALTAGLGPGITADKIRLGFIIVENNQKMLSFYGVQGGATGDTQAQVNAVVNDLNTRGGILGRKIETEFRTLDATAPGDSFPAFCTAFTQDKKVFAVLSPWNSNAGFHACLAKAGTLYITDSLTQEDIETFTDLRPYIVSGFMASSRGARTLAQALNSVGFFTPGAKVGVIRPNTPTGLRVYNQHFKPALASFGVTPVDDTFSGVQSDAGVNAAKRFNEKGIDHVAFITSAGGPPLRFMAGAQSQAYFPLYGLASPDSPTFLAQNAPPTQLHGAVGAGWSPGLDVFESEGPPLTPAETRCLEVHKKGGTEYSSRGGGDVGAFVAMTFCDMMWLFEEAATKAGRNLNVAAFATELAKFGDSHQSTVTFAATYGPGIFDGAKQYRPLAYDDNPSCRCFRYSAPAQNAPR